jgi:integrase
MMPRKPKKKITYLTKQEVDAFFRVIRSARDKALFRLYIATDCVRASPAS